MLAHLIRKELLEQLLSLRFAMACIICLVITLSSAVVLTRDYKEALADYRTNVVMHENELEESGDIWDDGVVIDKPLSPMRIFVRGIDPRLVVSARITHEQQPIFEAEHEVNPVSYLFPPVDMLFFIGIVMSLLALAFGYDAVSGEKESGTLKLLMSYSAPRDLVLLAKWVGGYLALTAPFLLAVTAALVVVMVIPGVELGEQDWVALVLLVAVGLLYLAAVYGMGILVSARTHLTSTSITVLLMAWVLMILVVPNVAPYLAAEAVPLRNFVEVEEEKAASDEAVGEAFEEEIDEFQEKNPDVERWGDDGRWGAMWNLRWQKRVLQRIDDEGRIEGQYANELAAQVSLARNLSRLSPFSSFAYAATELAGAGLTEDRRFRQSLPEYRRSLTVYVTELYSRAWAEQRMGERHDLDDRPRWVYRPTPVAERLAGVLPDVMLLAAWTVLFFMAAYLSFLRYDIK